MWRHDVSVSVLVRILTRAENGGVLGFGREGFAARSARCDIVPVDRVRVAARCGHQGQDGEGRVGTAVQLVNGEGVVGGALACATD